MAGWRPGWWPAGWSGELAPDRHYWSGADQGPVLEAAAEIEAELFGPPLVVAPATCACGDFRCLGDANGVGCFQAVAWQDDARFLVGPDGPADVAGMGWPPDGAPEVGLWAQQGDSLFWLDAHPSGRCRNPSDPNCQGGCGG
jgi:hypothetical protein